MPFKSWPHPLLRKRAVQRGSCWPQDLNNPLNDNCNAPDLPLPTPLLTSQGLWQSDEYDICQVHSFVSVLLVLHTSKIHQNSFKEGLVTNRCIRILIPIFSTFFFSWLSQARSQVRILGGAFFKKVTFLRAFWGKVDFFTCFFGKSGLFCVLPWR